MTKHPTCRTCDYCDILVVPLRGTRGGTEIDIGSCHGNTPRLTTESAGAFPPVALDIDWCRHHPDFTPRRTKL